MQAGINPMADLSSYSYTQVETIVAQLLKGPAYAGPPPRGAKVSPSAPAGKTSGIRS